MDREVPREKNREIPREIKDASREKKEVSRERKEWTQREDVILLKALTAVHICVYVCVCMYVVFACMCVRI